MTFRIGRAAPRWRAAIAVWLFLSAAAIHAQPAPEWDAAYEQAMEAIRNEQLAEAIHRLETLRARTPEHAGALLDLAILYCRVGDKAKVDGALSTLEEEFGPPPKILALIQELRQRDCSAHHATLWSVSMGLGHDTNVNQGSSINSFFLGTGPSLIRVSLDDEFLPQSSAFLSLNAYISRATDATNRIYGAFAAQRYASVRRFDQATMALGYERTLPGDDWELSAGMNAAMKTLGGSLYQSALGGGVRIVPPAPYRWDLPVGLEVRLAYLHYPTRTSFDNLETSVLVPSFWQFSDKLAARASAGWLVDNARGPRPGGDRAGATMGVEFFYRASDAWRAYAGWQARFLDGETPYAPPLLDAVQRQRRHLLSLAVERMLSEGSLIRLEYQHTENTDTIPIYRFDNDSIVLHWVLEGRR